ncbi:MAG: hypothetical protein HC888_17400 [Candidatus Competibacteraceae bacterium]|nr:hypothetical protein [Candidatus Competibacteraceae bacterium]
MNLDLSAPIGEVLQNFVPQAATGEESPENFAMSTEDLVRKCLDDAIQSINSKREISPLNRNKLIVAELFNKGIFDVRGAIDQVARELGVSRYTVYNYVREARQ